MTIFVGADKEKFVVHKDLICSKSEYFRAAFAGRFKEAEEEEMRFENVSPAVFRTVINWVYTGLLEFENGSNKINEDSFGQAYGVYF